MDKIKNRLYVLSFVFLEKEPFLEVELKQVLSQERYKIEKESIFKEGPLSIKNMKVAEKNNCDIVYNPDEGTLFVAGPQRAQVNEEFLRIKRILTEKLEIDLEDIIRSYELISDNQVVSTNKTPKDIIKDYYNNVNTNKFDEIFEEKTSNIMIRIVPEGKNSKSNNWFDLIIEPVSNRFYRLRLVYRNKNIEKVENIALNIEETLEKIITVAEAI